MKKLINNRGFAHIEVIFTLVVLVIIILAGSMVYQSNTDKSYTSKIQIAYSEQATQMKKLYGSFLLPVFASNNSTATTDSEELSTITQEISRADKLTDNLKTTNNIVLLPLISSGKIRNQHKAIAQYINNSVVFLQQYQKLDSYTKGFEVILNGPFIKAVAALNQLGNATSLQDFVNQLNNNPNLNFLNIAELLNQLNPPDALKDFNNKVKTAISNFQSDYATVGEDVENCLNNEDLMGNCQDFPQLSQKLISDSLAFIDLYNYNLAGYLQNQSTIHRQILELKAEKPLSNY